MSEWKLHSVLPVKLRPNDKLCLWNDIHIKLIGVIDSARDSEF